jgi:hypothetical protein
VLLDDRRHQTGGITAQPREDFGGKCGSHSARLFPTLRCAWQGVPDLKSG